MRAVLRTILRIAAGLVLLVVAAFAALAGYMIYAGNAADRAAEAFCNTVEVGANAADVAVRASQTRGFSTLRRGDGYVFVFQGGIFHAGVCHVSVLNGKVLSTRTGMEGD